MNQRHWQLCLCFPSSLDECSCSDCFSLCFLSSPLSFTPDTKASFPCLTKSKNNVCWRFGTCLPMLLTQPPYIPYPGPSHTACLCSSDTSIKKASQTCLPHGSSVHPILFCLYTLHQLHNLSTHLFLVLFLG